MAEEHAPPIKTFDQLQSYITKLHEKELLDICLFARSAMDFSERSKEVMNAIAYDKKKDTARMTEMLCRTEMKNREIEARESAVLKRNQEMDEREKQMNEREGELDQLELELNGY